MPRYEVDGWPVTVPTRAEVEGLRPGDIAPTVCGELPVIEVTCQKNDIHGKAFVCYICRFGPTSSITGSMKEGEPEADLRLISRYLRTDLIPLPG